MEQKEESRLYDGIEKLGSKFDAFAANTSDRLTKIETMFGMFERSQNNLSDKVDKVDKDATEALQSTRSAHKRLDNYEDDSPSKAEFEALKARTDKLDKIIFRITMTVITAVILAVLGTVLINK